MSHIESGNGKGGRSKVVEPNLVPFIDLMSVLITFLLITAVWSQVSMIQIGSSIYGKKNDSDPKPQLPPNVEIAMRLDISTKGYELFVGTETFKFPIQDGVFDEMRLNAQLEKVKEQYPTKLDATIAMADNLPYERLIKGMDVLLKTGFSQISVLTGGPE